MGEMWVLGDRSYLANVIFGCNQEDRGVEDGGGIDLDNPRRIGAGRDEGSKDTLDNATKVEHERQPGYLYVLDIQDFAHGP
jgi:hypothetical protein